MRIPKSAAGPYDGVLFRKLSPAEEAIFRKWARENQPPDLSSWDVYHPICRQEWVAMHKEHIETSS